MKPVHLVCAALPGESPPGRSRQNDREMDREGHLNEIDFVRHINRKNFPPCKSNYVAVSGSIHPASFKGNSDVIAISFTLIYDTKNLTSPKMRGL